MKPDIRPAVSRGIKFLKEHKQDIKNTAIAGGIVIGNTIAGAVFVDMSNRVGRMEKDVATIGKVTAELVLQDTATTGELCRTQGRLFQLAGFPIDEPTIDGICTQREQVQLEYWRGVIENAKEGR